MSVDGIERQSNELIHVGIAYGDTPVTVTPLAPSGDSVTYDIVVTREARSTLLHDPNPLEKPTSPRSSARTATCSSLVRPAPLGARQATRVKIQRQSVALRPAWSTSTRAPLKVGASSRASHQVTTPQANAWGPRSPLRAQGSRSARLGRARCTSLSAWGRLARDGALGALEGRTRGFGHTLALDEDTLVVSAPDDASCATGVNGDQTDTGCVGSGAVYVYEQDEEGSWVERAYLKGSVVRAGDGFGTAIALDGERLVIASPGTDSCEGGADAELRDSGCESSGSVSIFDRYQNAWVFDSVLAAPVAQTGADLGRA